MKKPKKALIMFNGKFLECDSIIEIRSGVTDQEWFAICKSTIETYCFMRAAKDLGPAQISREDAKLFKRLGTSIEMMKQLDPINLGTLNIDTLSAEHVKLIDQEWKSVQSDIKIAHDKEVGGEADVVISSM